MSARGGEPLPSTRARCTPTDSPAAVVPATACPPSSAQAQTDLQTLQTDVKSLQAEDPVVAPGPAQGRQGDHRPGDPLADPRSSGPAPGARQLHHAAERPGRRPHQPAPGRERPGRQDHPDHHRSPELSVVAQDRRPHPLRQGPGRPGRGEPGPPGRPSSRTARRCRPARPRLDGPRCLTTPRFVPRATSPRSLLRPDRPCPSGEGKVVSGWARGKAAGGSPRGGYCGRKSC